MKNKLTHSILLFFFMSLFVLPVSSHGGEEAQDFKPKNEEVMVEDNISMALGIKTEPVKLSTFEEILETTGQLEEIPKNHFDVNAPVQGTVSSVLVDLGSVVSEGQALVVIQSSEIANLQASIDETRAQLETAKNNFEREKTLFGKGISAKKDFEASQSVLKSTESKIKSLEASLKILTGEPSLKERGVFEIKAKKSGSIVERSVTVGQNLNPNELLFHAIDLSKLWVSANIYEKDINKIAVGQKVLIGFDENPEKKYEAKITYIGSVIDEKSRTLPVKAELNNTENKFKPGAFVKLVIYTNKKKNAILIPSLAIIDNDEEKDEEHGHIVYVKDKNVYKPRNIDVSVHDKKYAEVISGLMAGELLVVEGGYQLQYAEGTDHDHENHDEHNHDEHSHTHENLKQTNDLPKSFIMVILGLVFGIFISPFFRRKKHDK